MEMYTDHIGAAPPSLEERIYLSDVVVRARLQSASSTVLTFSAIEYLKGNGPRLFVVNVDGVDSSIQQDDREALLFLSHSQGEVSGQSGGGSVPAFAFTDTTAFDYSPGHEYLLEATEYTGNLPPGYSPNTRNPVWLPATEPSDGGRGAIGAIGTIGGGTSTPAFVVGDPDEPVTLTDIRAKAAWVDGANGSAEYEECVKESLAYIRGIRDREAHFGKPVTIARFDYEMASGVGRGHEITDFGTHSWPEYDRIWLSLGDPSLFATLNVDDDTDPTNGYRNAVQTARPLPDGEYEFTLKMEPPIYAVCDFDTFQSGLTYIVTVTAPPGTLHEAFFDPATTTEGVGYSANPSAGVLEPSLLIATTSREIRGLEWDDGKVTLTLSPYGNLVGRQFEFINLDGEVFLTLGTHVATRNRAAGTLTWDVPTAPWSAGDQLMLRVSPIPLPETHPTLRLVITFGFGNAGVSFVWDALSDVDGAPVTAYSLEWALAEFGPWSIVDSPGQGTRCVPRMAPASDPTDNHCFLNYSDANLTPGRPYYLRLIAHADTADSLPSPAVRLR